MIMKTGNEDKVKKFSGDGISVDVDSNNRTLEVTGDGCKITLTRNSGVVRIVGDGCRLKVIHNEGEIEYEGDGGRVRLGPSSKKEGITYNGDGGRISFDLEPGKLSKSEKPECRVTTESSKKNENKRSVTRIVTRNAGCDFSWLLRTSNKSGKKTVTVTTR